MSRNTFPANNELRPVAMAPASPRRYRKVNKAKRNSICPHCNHGYQGYGKMSRSYSDNMMTERKEEAELEEAYVFYYSFKPVSLSFKQRK